MSVVFEKLKQLEPFLQKNVMFNIETKTVRRGRLLLFNIKDYYLKFIIRTNKDINKTYEIPYPYDVIPGENSITLSYKILDMCVGNEGKRDKVLQYEAESNSKLYDKTVIITNIDTDQYK
jgi:hypothetical protein